MSVAVTDFGYLRPDWIVLERDGMGAESRFPRDPDTDYVKRIVGVAGEEYGAEPGRSGRQWVLDPIDGTVSFMAGRPIFGTLIALGIPTIFAGATLAATEASSRCARSCSSRRGPRTSRCSPIATSRCRP